MHGAGRTDAGVHALGQVASVQTRTEHHAATLQRALNSVLPADVRIVSVEDAQPDFHARFDAISKTYEYRIANGPFVSAIRTSLCLARARYARRRGDACRGAGAPRPSRLRGVSVDRRRRAHNGAHDPVDIREVRPGSDRGQTGVRPGSDPAGHSRDGRRIPAAHGPDDRRHARRRRPRALAGESRCRDYRGARSLACGTGRAGIGSLSRRCGLRGSGIRDRSGIRNTSDQSFGTPA